LFDIRKISIGANYKSDAMHFLVGQPVLDKTYFIHHINYNDDMVNIYIEKDNEIFLWKSFNYNMPVSIEYNINF
jgi:hypothetical protein